jgi:hypothetical protein
MPRTSPRTLTRAYSPGITLHKSLAPAKHQARASSLILAMMTFVAEWWCRKTLALRSFQTSHEISMSKEAKALLCCPLSKAMFDHHTSTFGSLIQDSGGQSWIPHQARISFHTRKVKRHLYMRWSAVSCTWLQRGHMVRWLVFTLENFQSPHNTFKKNNYGATFARYNQQRYVIFVSTTQHINLNRPNMLYTPTISNHTAV